MKGPGQQDDPKEDRESHQEHPDQGPHGCPQSTEIPETKAMAKVRGVENLKIKRIPLTMSRTLDVVGSGIAVAVEAAADTDGTGRRRMTGMADEDDDSRRKFIVPTHDPALFSADYVRIAKCCDNFMKYIWANAQ